MPPRVRRAARLLLIAALIAMPFATLACGDDEDEPQSEEEAAAALCSDFDAFQTSLGDFASSISINSSSDDIRAARDDVSDAFDELRASAGEVAGFRIDELQEAWDNFVDAVEDIGEADSIADGISQVSTAAQELGTALGDSLTSLDCE